MWHDRLYEQIVKVLLVLNDSLVFSLYLFSFDFVALNQDPLWFMCSMNFFKFGFCFVGIIVCLNMLI